MKQVTIQLLPDYLAADTVGEMIDDKKSVIRIAVQQPIDDVQKPVQL